MQNFKSFNLPASLEKALAKLNLAKPTDVQVQAVPEIVNGKDIIVSAPTGTGKTLAFSMPAVAKLINDPEAHVIVVTPTRELATQIMSVMDKLLQFNRKIRSAVLIGGMPMDKQLRKLKEKPRLIVGTPGRINDHLKRKSLKLDQTKVLILDEMDRMLDMGFSVQIDEIIKFMPEERQTLMFSATIPPAIRKLTNKYLTEPASVTIDAAEIVNTDITQEFIYTDKEQKYHDLIDQLHKREGTKIIFCRTKRNTEDLAKKLSKDNFRAKAIHGDLRQHQREKIIRLLREGEYDIVVATDVAARGIDVPHIKHVINYHIPDVPEDYVHRVGRTGRAGQEGHSLTFVSGDQNKAWKALDHFLNPDKPKPKEEGGRRRRSGGGRRKPSSNGPARRNNKGRKFGDGDKARKSNKPSRPGRDTQTSREGKPNNRDNNRPNNTKDSSKPNRNKSKSRPEGAPKKPRRDGEKRKARPTGKGDGGFGSPKRSGAKKKFGG